VTIKGVELEM